MSNILLKISLPQKNRFGIVFILAVVICELTFKLKSENIINYKNIYVRRVIYLSLIYLIFAFFKFFELNQFIYFEF